MDNKKDLAELSTEEVRVLGALMEKSKTTPEYYPMTVNAIVSACNQKSARNPVTSYSEEIVMKSLRSLKGLGLVSLSVGGTNRTDKYKHNFHIVYDVNDAQFAALCLLFLRGPLTPGEINSSAGRLYSFSSLGSVIETLKTLEEHEPPFIKLLERRSGQKESRYAHLFSPVVEDNVDAFVSTEHVSPVEQRVAALETEVEELKQQLSFIMKELGYSNHEKSQDSAERH